MNKELSKLVELDNQIATLERSKLAQDEEQATETAKEIAKLQKKRAKQAEKVEKSGVDSEEE